MCLCPTCAGVLFCPIHLFCISPKDLDALVLLICTTDYDTNSMLDKTHRFAMDTQYDSANQADFDVVRSTQFMEDFTRAVRVLHV